MSDLALQLIAENKRTKATFLDLGNCGLAKAPPEICDLTWLESLSFASKWYEWDGKKWKKKQSANSGETNHSLSDIVPLAELRTLKRLIVSDTQVTDLAPLVLIISGGCPVCWNSKYRRGQGIYVKECPLTNPPPEIAKQGNEAILNYFSEHE